MANLIMHNPPKDGASLQQQKWLSFGDGVEVGVLALENSGESRRTVDLNNNVPNAVYRIMISGVVDIAYTKNTAVKKKYSN